MEQEHFYTQRKPEMVFKLGVSTGNGTGGKRGEKDYKASAVRPTSDLAQSVSGKAKGSVLSSWQLAGRLLVTSNPIRSNYCFPGRVLARLTT